MKRTQAWLSMLVFVSGGASVVSACGNSDQDDDDATEGDSGGAGESAGGKGGQGSGGSPKGGSGPNPCLMEDPVDGEACPSEGLYCVGAMGADCVCGGLGDDNPGRQPRWECFGVAPAGGTSSAGGTSGSGGTNASGGSEAGSGGAAGAPGGAAG